MEESSNEALNDIETATKARRWRARSREGKKIQENNLLSHGNDATLAYKTMKDLRMLWRIKGKHICPCRCVDPTCLINFDLHDKLRLYLRHLAWIYFWICNFQLFKNLFGIFTLDLTIDGDINKSINEFNYALSFVNESQHDQYSYINSFCDYLEWFNEKETYAMLSADPKPYKPSQS